MTRGSTLGNPTAVPFRFSRRHGGEVLIANLSGIAIDDPHAWTVSDEGRTVERFFRVADGFELVEQVSLDATFRGLPEGHEADLESIDIADGRIWVCGSHCRVRKSGKAGHSPSPELVKRPSRNLLGYFSLDDAGSARAGSGIALPYQGDGSLRRRLRAVPLLAPFLDGASKENGLDIEGMVVTHRTIYLGLRGPVVDNAAVVVALRRLSEPALVDDPPRLYFLDLGGIGVRDLARDGDSLLILAGPITSAGGPFRLFRWWPDRSKDGSAPKLLHQWPMGREHPEGICPWVLSGEPGVLVVYDAPDRERIVGTTVHADWFAYS